MTTYAEVFEYPRSWTEEDFLALPDDGPRIELVDGALVVSPMASRAHQRVGRNAVHDLAMAAPDQLEVHDDINVRVGPVRILIPDLVITDNPGGTESVVDTANVVMVGEITSPSNAGIDRLVKPQAYAAAGIRWFLRIDLAEAPSGAPAAALDRLDDGHYREVAAAGPGEVLVLTEPFPVQLDLAALAHRTRPPGARG